MDPHPLANLFKRSNYVEPIASELSALDFLYEVLLEDRESENCGEVLEEGIYNNIIAIMLFIQGAIVNHYINFFFQYFITIFRFANFKQNLIKII